MRNIGRIFLDDLQFVRSNIIVVLAVLGLCLATVVFAWFSIAGSWSSYENTSQLKVAVSNGDEGYESALTPMRLNIGDRVVGMLRENDEYNWVFVDEQDALDGVRSGEYFAALTIPEDFSSKTMSVFSTDAEQVKIGFYVNAKENPSASVIAGEGGAEVEEGIRAEFTEAVDEMALDLAADLVAFAGGENSKDFGARLVAHLDDTAANLDALAEQVRAYSNVAGAVSSVASASAQSLSDSESVAKASGEEVESVSEALDAAVESAQSAASDIQAQVNAAKESGNLGDIGTDTASDLANDVVSLANSVSTVSSEADTMASTLGEAVKSLSSSTDSVVANLEGARNQLGIAANKLDASSAKIRKFQEDVASAIAKGDLADVATIIGGSEANLAKWLSEPVQVEKTVVYPLENYGSSLAPFYTMLSLWAGAIVLVLILRTDVSEERLRRYEEMRGRPVRNYEQYLGRCLIFGLIMLVQATVVGIGNLFFLRIQCADPLFFLVACWVSALVFGLVAYTLAVTFGEIGKALCIIVLIVQVVGASVAYPMPMMADFFQVLYPLLPLSHGIHALQAAVAGIYFDEYAFDLLALAAFVIPSLFLGLVVRGPIVRAANHLGGKLAKTGLM